MASDQAAAQSTEKIGKLRWPTIKKTVRKHGVPATVFPFLEIEDPRDVALVNELLTHEPFAAGYGNILDAWKLVAANLTNSKTATGAPLFGSHIVTIKAIRDRFAAMADAGKLMPKRQSNTGVSAFTLKVEDLISKYDTFVADREAAKPFSRKRKKEAAAAVVAAPKYDTWVPTRNPPTSTAATTPVATPTTAVAQGQDASKRQKTGPLVSTFAVGTGLGDETSLDKSSKLSLLHQYELEKERLERKRKEQELEEKKLALDRERFEEEKAQRKFEREQDALDREHLRKSQEAQTLLMQNMISMLQQKK